MSSNADAQAVSRKGLVTPMNFPARRYDCFLEAMTTLELPPYPGSTLRGAFGHALRRVVCPLMQASCEACSLRDRCLYLWTFETPLAGVAMSGGLTTHAPHPFVLEPPLDPKTTYRPGDTISMGLVLIGVAIETLPYHLRTLDEMGQRGLGRGRGRTRLREVRSGGLLVYDGKTGTYHDTQPVTEEKARESGDSIRLEILTPLRLKVRNRYTDLPTFEDLIRNLLVRIRTLADYHAPHWVMPDTTEVLEAARQARLTSTRLQWVDWDRYSSRQDVRMQLGGVVGNMDIEGSMDTLWPWLRLGELIHAGKGTSFGLGRYHLAGHSGPTSALG